MTPKRLPAPRTRMLSVHRIKGKSNRSKKVIDKSTKHSFRYDFQRRNTIGKNIQNSCQPHSNIYIFW